MRLQLYSHEDLFEIGKAIINSVTGIQYPFHERTFHRALITAQAMFGANASVESIRTVKGGSLEGIKGPLLERKALESGVVKYPSSPARASGRFIPIDPGGSGSAIAIPPSTIVIREATATQTEARFKTEAAGLISAPGGVIDASSNLIYITCTEDGEKGNSIPANTELKLKNPVNGVTNFKLSTESGGGNTRETDPSLRNKARAAKKGHGQVTWSGLEYLLTTVSLSTGNRVTAAKVFEAFDEPSPLYTGIAYAIIDDGSGDSTLIGPVDSTTYGPYDAFVSNPDWSYTATKTDVYVDLPQPHIELWDDQVNAGVRKNGGAVMTEGTDFWVDSDAAKLAFATPLVAGDVIEVQFNFYTGLVREAAYYVNGIPGSETVKGWRPIGYKVRIRPSQSVTKPALQATIVFKDGYDSTYGKAFAASLVVSYLNGLPIGDPARYNVIGSILHKVPGVSYVENYTLASGTADISPTHKFGCIRGDLTQITL